MDSEITVFKFPSKQLEQLRKLVFSNISDFLYSSSIFFATKLHSIAKSSLTTRTKSTENLSIQEIELKESVYLVAYTYFVTRQFKRALHLLQKNNCVSWNPKFKHLSARCCAELCDWEGCQAILELSNARNTIAYEFNEQKLPLQEIAKANHNFDSKLDLLRGKIYCIQDNKSKAVAAFVSALKKDIYCIEAFDNILEFSLVTAYEAKSIIENCLKENLQQSSKEEIELQREIYYTKLATSFNLFSNALQAELSSALVPIQEKNPRIRETNDFLILKAMEHIYRRNFNACYDISKKLLEEDPYTLDSVLMININCLIELNKKSEIYMLAHKLVEEHPELPISWFAVACYYLMIRDYDTARKHFTKATALGITLATSRSTDRINGKVPTVPTSFGQSPSTSSLSSNPYKHAHSHAIAHPNASVSPKSPNIQENVQETTVMDLHAYVYHYLHSSNTHIFSSLYGLAVGSGSSWKSIAGWGWVGFGHSFAYQGEHDQAMSAYRTASRLLLSSHVPLLCIAMELSFVNNYNLALQHISQAKALEPNDPLIYNEMGVIAFKTKKYEDAIQSFKKALSMLGYNTDPSKSPFVSNNVGSLAATCEPILSNLAHSYRKLRLYDEAIACFEESLSLVPERAATYSALAFTYQLQGNLQAAIDTFHHALGIKPDDGFASEMLEECLQAFSSSSNFAL